MPVGNVSLLWHSYRYFPYEKALARREIEMLLDPQEIHPTQQGFDIEGNVITQQALNRLVYFQRYVLADDRVFSTFQHQLESTCVNTGHQNRQSTRYSVHGLHEYRGKFNPQIVRAILNILDIEPSSTVIDPFCGSGTTLVECSHNNATAFGCDMNPLAVFISNAKLQALSVPSSLLEGDLKRIVDGFATRDLLPAWADRASNDASPRTDYLKKWFDAPVLRDIEALKAAIEQVEGQRKSIFLALASDLLRAYSLQEPADLRTRRRKSSLPEIPILSAFQAKAMTFIKNLALTQGIVGVKEYFNRAYLCDSRSTKSEQWHKPNYYDAAITSPPYATALPYIDTQRLSLIWIGLIEPEELRLLEADLTGSREFSGNEKPTWVDGLQNNHEQLPPIVHDYCMRLENAVEEKDGFRRKAVPSLLYRYFSDMQHVFRNVFNLLKGDAPFALVVGHNHTKLGGEQFKINTPELLKEVAMDCGWSHQESIPLETYHRYGIHTANSVRTETLLILRKPG